MTHVEFDINWIETLKALGWILLGALIVVLIIAYVFRNFRLF
jgi:hypothetical protein